MGAARALTAARGFRNRLDVCGGVCECSGSDAQNALHAETRVKTSENRTTLTMGRETSQVDTRSVLC